MMNRWVRRGGAGRRQFIFCVLILGLGLWTPVLWADAAEQEQRIAALEARIAALEALLQQMNTRLAAASEAAPAAVVANPPAAVADAAEPVADSGAVSHEFLIGGYIKVDALLSRYSDGDLPSGNVPGRNFFDPNSIPVGGDSESVDLDVIARTSRFHIGTEHRFENGDELDSYVELDFINTEGGNERFSNSYVARLRHAYLRYNRWLVGQYWTNFADTEAYPETLDFTGPAGSVVFARQPQLRYTRGDWSIALENPETTITPNGGGPRITADDSLFPDLTASYLHRHRGGYWRLSSVLRQLDFEDNESGVKERELAWGLNFSGGFELGRDDFRWNYTHSEGIGRYIGFNYTNDAVLTPAGRLDAVSADSGYLSYRHWWNTRWRSTAVLAYAQVDNPRADTGLEVIKNVWSGQFNVIYSPYPDLSFGLEYTYAERELENGLSGNLQRVQLSGKYVY